MRHSPKDNVDRAISKSLGNDMANYEDVRYEGYGPGGVAIIVEALKQLVPNKKLDLD